jgi:hypothetical protein
MLIGGKYFVTLADCDRFRLIAVGVLSVRGDV